MADAASPSPPESPFARVETQNVDFPALERAVLNFWDENGIFEKRKALNAGKPRWSFLDGPITANNPMGVHHAWGRTLKDIFLRYKAMHGFYANWQNAHRDRIETTTVTRITPGPSASPSSTP